MPSKSKIPPEFAGARAQILQVVGDDVELFGFHAYLKGIINKFVVYLTSERNLLKAELYPIMPPPAAALLLFEEHLVMEFH